jgi:hypothetical protein
LKKKKKKVVGTWLGNLKLHIDRQIDGWRVSLRHHDPQRQIYTAIGSAIENAEVDSAGFSSRIVVSHRRTHRLSELIYKIVSTCHLQGLPPVSLNLVHVLVFFFIIFLNVFLIIILYNKNKVFFFHFHIFVYLDASLKFGERGYTLVFFK